LAGIAAAATFLLNLSDNIELPFTGLGRKQARNLSGQCHITGGLGNTTDEPKLTLAYLVLGHTAYTLACWDADYTI
jgi:hypothetical protein